MSSALLPVAVSALHLLALGIGLPGIALRARALSRGDLEAALSADNAWGIAALLWAATGLARAFGGLEKGTSFYLDSSTFQLKMGLLLAVGVLELWPMGTLLWWRIAQARGKPIDRWPIPWLARISWLQVLLIIAIPFVAAAMARGL